MLQGWSDLCLWSGEMPSATHRLLLCTALAAALLGGRTAVAQPGGDAELPPGLAPQPAPARTETVVREHRYGLEILLVDGSVLAATLATQNPGVLFAGFALGGPTVHLIHGNPGRAALSAGLRVGLPLAGAYLGAASADCSRSDDWCGLGELVVGGAIGGLVALAIDASMLAVDQTTEEAPLRYRGIRATPMMGATRGGMTLGLDGSF